ncbi:hypothetical protein HK099_007775 [Clydaea vesicula]|uniref:Peptide transporter n=1 Tax=Clydaea vesicula TaxID=447962 RepID=A0AAD5XXT7_9FUNG|nr:hypothetical protein HK099_007775 [Clydaea vesicula]
MSEKLNLEELQLKVKEKEALLNAEIDAKIQRNPEKLPQAIYYIVPNEFGERYCFYGLSNTLNGYIKKHLKLGETKGIQYVSMFKSLSYFTPLLGAALSDSFFGKYETIVALSFLYVIGMSLTAMYAEKIFHLLIL